MMRSLRWIALGFAFSCSAIAALWSVGALYFDFPWPALRGVAAVLLVLVFLGVLKGVRGPWRKLGVGFSIFAVVLAWWLTLKPSNEGNWQPNVGLLAEAQVDGDVVTLHNVRNFEYRTEDEFTERWETRKVRISQITGVDMAINYWGSPWMAHPILSFQFADSPPLCFSIETRKRVGQSYSAIGGLFRQYSLVFVVADERDVIRVRSNYRKGEDVYLYRTTISPERARERFLEYINSINALRRTPRWYNAVTTNCTMAIRSQHPPEKRLPFDWRILLNGKGDELMSEMGMIEAAGLPFSELKRRSLINSAAHEANDSPDFSKLIRSGRPGF
jgi:hypothetical protein